MQETWVQSLVQEDPIYLGATKPMHHNYWACALEPRNHHYWVHAPPLLKSMHPRACAPQQEKPLQWEAHALQQRVAPALCSKRKALTAAKTQHSNEDPAEAKINRYIKLFKKRKPLVVNIMKGLELQPKDPPTNFYDKAQATSLGNFWDFPKPVDWNKI